MMKLFLNQFLLCHLITRKNWMFQKHHQELLHSKLKILSTYYDASWNAGKTMTLLLFFKQKNWLKNSFKKDFARLWYCTLRNFSDASSFMHLLILFNLVQVIFYYLKNKNYHLMIWHIFDYHYIFLFILIYHSLLQFL